MMPKKQSEAVLGFSSCLLVILEAADAGYHGAPVLILHSRLHFMSGFKNGNDLGSHLVSKIARH